MTHPAGCHVVRDVIIMVSPRSSPGHPVGGRQPARVLQTGRWRTARWLEYAGSSSWPAWRDPSGPCRGFASKSLIRRPLGRPADADIDRRRYEPAARRTAAITGESCSSAAGQGTYQVSELQPAPVSRRTKRSQHVDGGDALAAWRRRVSEAGVARSGLIGASRWRRSAAAGITSVRP